MSIDSILKKGHLKKCPFSFICFMGESMKQRIVLLSGLFFLGAYSNAAPNTPPSEASTNELEAAVGASSLLVEKESELKKKAITVHSSPKVEELKIDPTEKIRRMWFSPLACYSSDIPAALKKEKAKTAENLRKVKEKVREAIELKKIVNGLQTSIESTKERAKSLQRSIRLLQLSLPIAAILAFLSGKYSEDKVLRKRFETWKKSFSSSCSNNKGTIACGTICLVALVPLLFMKIKRVH